MASINYFFIQPIFHQFEQKSLNTNSVHYIAQVILMNENIHNGVAKAHFKIAEDYDKKFREETHEEQKKINRIVAAQNYFYSAINAIEAVFAKELKQHSFNHENRYRKFVENQKLFSDEISALFIKVDRDERNKVAYKGENGQMYEDMRKLAKLLQEAI